MERLLTDAMEDQGLLGPMKLEKGLIANMWKKVQSEWDRQHHIKKYKGIWILDAITALQTYTLECWKCINEYEHGTTKSFDTTREILAAKIKHLYEMPRDNLLTQDLKYFKLPYEQRINCSIEAMATWGAMIENLF